jgi:hypothetical protein
VAVWVEQGPDRARDGVVRWRCIDLRDRIQQEFGVQYHERSVGKLLSKLAFRRLSVRTPRITLRRAGFLGWRASIDNAMAVGADALFSRIAHVKRTQASATLRSIQAKRRKL